LSHIPVSGCFFRGIGRFDQFIEERYQAAFVSREIFGLAGQLQPLK